MSDQLFETGEGTPQTGVRPEARRSLARAITSRTSGRPALTAESSSKAPLARAAMIRATVVLPLPGGP